MACFGSSKRCQAESSCTEGQSAGMSAEVNLALVTIFKRGLLSPPTAEVRAIVGHRRLVHNWTQAARRCFLASEHRPNVATTVRAHRTDNSCGRNLLLEGSNLGHPAAASPGRFTARPC